MTVTPEDAARAAFVAISGAANSTEASTQLLRLFADAFPRAMGTLDLAAERVAGTAPKTGPKISALDLALVEHVRTRQADLGSHAVGAVVRVHYPGSPREQRNAEKRLRRLLKQDEEIGTSSNSE